MRPPITWLGALFGLTLAAGAGWAQQTKPPTPPPHAEGKQIIVLPPMEWDWPMSAGQDLLHQGPGDLAALTGGIEFGLGPRDVSATLPDQTPGLSWADLPNLDEFTQDVRYFWVGIGSAQSLSGTIAACTGEKSHVVFLFREGGLFRVSFRFLPDETCPDTGPAARTVFARYSTIGPTVALTVHYRHGKTEVVDVTDPGAGELLNERWRAPGQ